MKTTTYIFTLIVLALFGCSQGHTKEDLRIKEKIKGNWKTEYFKTDWNETAFTFLFQDSTCSYLYPLGAYSKYWVIGDTLYIKERIQKRRNHISGGKLTYKFLIENLTKNP